MKNMISFDEVEKIVEKHIEKYAYEKQCNILKMIREVEKMFNGKKDIRDLNIEDWQMVIKSKNPSTKSSVYTLIDHIKLIQDALGIEKITCRDFDLESLAVDKNKRAKEHFTIQEIQDLCNSLINPQDKFIVYSLFLGIHSKEEEELRNLKEENIDLENKRIYVRSGIIEMDDFMYDICKDCLDKPFNLTYYKYVTSEEFQSKDQVTLNPESKYIIKTKPTKSNNDGLGAMTYPGFRTRMKSLNEYTGLNVRAMDIVRSGIMHKMHLLHKKEWTVVEIEALCKMNRVKMSAYELKLSYEMKYSKNVK